MKMTVRHAARGRRPNQMCSVEICPCRIFILLIPCCMNDRPRKDTRWRRPTAMPGVSFNWPSRQVRKDALATAKLGTENDLTAKRAKNAKKEREEEAQRDFDRKPRNGIGRFTNIDLAEDGGAQCADAGNPHDPRALPSLPTAFGLHQ
jgi:hypothetical protein